MIRPVTILNRTQNCHSHEKGKVFHAPKKTKPLPTGIGCHSLCTWKKKKKINRASAQPAQGPSLKPRSPGTAVCLCFPVCGQLAWPGARVRDLYGRKSCGVLSHAGWKLLRVGSDPDRDTRSAQSSRNKVPAAEAASRPAFFMALLTHAAP